MIAKELGQLLEDNGIGTLGTDIFVGEFPKDNDSGNGIQSGLYLESISGEGQDEYLSIRYENIDIWSLDPLYETAHDTLKSVHNLLSRGQNYITDNYNVYFSHDISGIGDYGRTEDGLKMWKFTLRTIYRDVNLIS